VGVLTKQQLSVLELRSKGLTQREIARELDTTKANISMIEWRARRKIMLARETIRAYELMKGDLRIEIGEGTKLAGIRTKVLDMCDRRQVQLRSTVPDIIDVIKSLKPDCIEDGRVSRKILLRIGRRGDLHSERFSVH